MSTERKQILVDFLKKHGASFEQDQLTGFTDSPAPDRHAPALSVLDHQALLTITGPDSARFLQGQLTSNIEALAPGHYQPGAACTAKGRMFSSFNLLHTDSGYLLGMHEGLVETTAATLSKYAVFFKTTIDTESSLVCLGLSGQDIDDNIKAIFGTIPEGSNALSVAGGWLFQVPGLCSRFELWLDVQELTNWWPKLTGAFTPTYEQHWRTLAIEAVRPQLLPEALEQYIPQHLNLPTLGAVSFRKGCYTGQEIVARMQNLGQLKSRSYRLTAEQLLDLQPGTKLFDNNGKPIGEILEAVPVARENVTEMLAVIRVEAAETNNVHLDSGEGPAMKVKPLPYQVDTRTELQK